MVVRTSVTSDQIRVVRAQKGLKSRISEIYSRRELLVFLVKKELSTKYRNSTMGFAWSMLNPAFMLGVWYFVFQVVMRTTIPDFVVYLMTGLIAWNFFAVSLQSSSAAVVENAGLVNKVSFPREVLALAKVGQAMVFFVLQLSVLIITMAIMRFVPNFSQMYLLIPAVIDLVLFTSALCILVSALNVYYRDIQHFIEVLLFGWFFGSPIVYSYTATLATHLAKKHLTWLYLANPMADIGITFDRVLYGIVYYKTNGVGAYILPTFSTTWFFGMLGGIFLGSLILMLIALKVFQKLEVNFAEEL